MKKKNLINNIYVKNILALIVVSSLLILTVFFGLKVYTQHGRAVEVPDVKGLPVEEAGSVLLRKNIFYSVIDSVFIKNVVPGTIVETIPPVGSMVKEGRTIYLKVNSYLPQLITVPDVINSSQRIAYAMLRSLGFEKIEIKPVPGIYRELVTGLESRGQTMEAGHRIPANTPLSLLVSSGAGDIILLENLIDSTEVSIDESYF